MVYKALLWTSAFWISYIKWYKLYNSNLFVVLESKQRGTLKLVNLSTERQFNCWLSLSLNFLFNLPRLLFLCLLSNHSRMRLFYDVKSNLYNVFILKCVSITNVSIAHYMRVLFDNNKKQNKQKMKINILWKIVLSSFSIFHTKILYTTK